jgi:hypothetical protein
VVKQYQCQLHTDTWNCGIFIAFLGPGVLEIEGGAKKSEKKVKKHLRKSRGMISCSPFLPSGRRFFNLTVDNPALKRYIRFNDKNRYPRCRSERKKFGGRKFLSLGWKRFWVETPGAH